MSEIKDSKDFTVSRYIGGALIFATSMEECFSKEPIVNILEEALLRCDKLQSDYDKLKRGYELMRNYYVDTYDGPEETKILMLKNWDEFAGLTINEKG